MKRFQYGLRADSTSEYDGACISRSMLHTFTAPLHLTVQLILLDVRRRIGQRPRASDQAEPVLANVVHI